MLHARHQSVSNPLKLVNDCYLAARLQQIERIIHCLMTAWVTWIHCRSVLISVSPFTEPGRLNSDAIWLPDQKILSQRSIYKEKFQSPKKVQANLIQCLGPLGLRWIWLGRTEYQGVLLSPNAAASLSMFFMEGYLPWFQRLLQAWVLTFLPDSRGLQELNSISTI